MAGFVPIRRGHKRRQPKGPQSINWALELSRGLELALVAPDRFSPDIAYGRTVNTVTGTFWAGNTEYGEGLDFPAENTRSVSYNVPLLDKPFTLILGYKLNAIPTATRHVAGNYITNTSGFRIYASGTEFAAQFGRAGAAQVLHGSSVALGNKIDAVVADATTFSYYENGVLSDSQGQAGFVAPTKLFELGGSASPVMTIAFCYYFSRALSAREIAELYEAPYKLLMPSTEIILIDSGLVNHDLSGDIVGPGAELTGELNHFAPGTEVGSILVAGDIVGPGAEMSGELFHYNPASVTDHGITADLLGGCVAEMTGTLLRSTPYTPPVPPEPTQAFGGFWDLPTGQHRSERIKALKQKESELIEQELEIELNKYPDSVNMLATIQDNKAAILEQIMAIQAEQERFKQEFNIKARLLLLN